MRGVPLHFSSRQTVKLHKLLLAERANVEARKTKRGRRSFPGYFRVFVRLKYVPSRTRGVKKVQGKGRKWRREAVAGGMIASCLASFHDSEIRAKSIYDVTASHRSPPPEASTKNILEANSPSRVVRIVLLKFLRSVSLAILWQLQQVTDKRVNST